jgi:hypothetical protein
MSQDPKAIPLLELPETQTFSLPSKWPGDEDFKAAQASAILFAKEQKSFDKVLESPVFLLLSGQLTRNDRC